MPGCENRKSRNSSIRDGGQLSDAARAAEMAARASYGRLLAFLSARTSDIAQAEDALADAFAKALDHWPTNGVPGNPDAWLLTVARNRLTDVQRRRTRFPTEHELPDMPEEESSDPEFPDQRLALMMVCAHPAIAADLHTPLMLQTVLGLDAKHIARLYLMSPAALSKRLVRAKTKIRDAGIPFKVPDQDVLPERSNSVLEAIYGLHAHDWLDPAETLGEEALYLSDLLCKLLPDNAEALGLSALIAFSHARVNARLVAGVLVPTDEQDTKLWNDELISYGKRHLSRAYRLKAVDRFQIEAAIEAVHIERKQSGETDWKALNKLYHAYLTKVPTAGGLVAQAAITGRLHGAEAGLAAIEAIEESVGPAFQPFWAVKADMEARAGRNNEALACYEKAISLATDLPTIEFLKQRRITVLPN